MPLPPLSLYVHLPWCVRKCPYCDFNSHAAPAQIPQRDYVDALLEDLDLDRPAAGDRPLISIFFGGGTPSLFSPEEIGRFLAGVRQRIACADDMEVTLEANPGTIEHGRFRGYREAGVTRVSLGVQSFNDEHLKVLGRIHGSGDIRRAVDELRQAGLDNFNLDLMYGLPQQSREQALADLAAAIALEPAHLSHYQLTLEPGTVFHHRPPPLPDHDTTWEMQLECQALLASSGYEQYEISAYARAGRRCRHNLNYWQFGDYVGVGAGAHGKLTGSAVERTTRSKQPRDYLSRTPAERVSERRTVAAGELSFEFMLNALRLREGFAVPLFEERTGLSIDSIDAELRAAQTRGLLHSTGRAWEPTELGFRFLNDLQEMFLPANC
ncbi:MAG TPA: radical SAM family heme chaperone HemW [Povalibacter sp.]|uniref:radical SAM family heme chaperone HemW n=1 Tax=Povalibacter sp. TaxID=1962978 RepID=UPI002C106236|nr:radical SAM family heme chaperone HemW [Povalibacter sp.]HMN45826.1 radical SAM family heme chaperone HemW [Povalibacter sp.]